MEKSHNSLMIWQPLEVPQSWVARNLDIRAIKRLRPTKLAYTCEVMQYILEVKKNKLLPCVCVFKKLQIRINSLQPNFEFLLSGNSCTRPLKNIFGVVLHFLLSLFVVWECNFLISSNYNAISIPSVNVSPWCQSLWIKEPWAYS